MKDRCPHIRDTAQVGDLAADLQTHVSSCPDCAQERAAVLELANLAGEMPCPPPNAERMDQIRGALIASALRPPIAPRRRVGWLAVAAGLLIAVAGGSWLGLRSGPTGPIPARRATVHATAAARFEHDEGDTSRPELVRLAEGEVTVDVEHLAAGERFMVVTDDAEVEVRGTSFDVAADSNRLQGVRVRSGVVEVRWRDRPSRLLRAGDHWAPPTADVEAEPPRDEPEATEAPAKAPVEAAKVARPVPTSRAVPRRPRPVLPVTEVANERAFSDAWAAFARGDMRRAAELFSEAEQAAPESPLAEDARYGRAVALARDGRRDEAIDEMERFLERHPDAARAEEVSVALGWLLLESGAFREAERRFEAAASSAVDRVRRSASRGLDEVADREGRLAR